MPATLKNFPQFTMGQMVLLDGGRRESTLVTIVGESPKYVRIERAEGHRMLVAPALLSVVAK